VCMYVCVLGFFYLCEKERENKKNVFFVVLFWGVGHSFRIIYEMVRCGLQSGVYVCMCMYVCVLVFFYLHVSERQEKERENKKKFFL
jgi:hypothetical protein